MQQKIIELQTNQNYSFGYIHYEEKYENDLKKIVGFRLTTKLIKENSKFESITLFSFRNTSDNDDELVLEICKNDKNQIFIKTGLYIGEICINNLIFSILPGLGNKSIDKLILYRMLNYSNNIFIDKSNNIKGNTNSFFSEFPLFEYLFLTSLQKSSILGFPQVYQSINKHELNYKGSLNINAFIKKDIPFKGKISFSQNSRKPIQEIIDVLYCALTSVSEEITSNFSRLAFIKSELKDQFSGIKPSKSTIEKAKNHRVLNNPMFREFKRTIKFAELVLKHKGISPQENQNDESFSGYLLDIASLWELYLQGVLTKYLPDWNIKTQEKNELYDGMFYQRNNYPDLVLEKDGKYIIFDAKFKRMKFDYYDVDRTDLFQIHSYIAYYNFLYPDNIVMGGLIYPLLEKINVDQCHSNKIYGNKAINSDIKFIIDGIYFGSISDITTLNDLEKEFINRVRSEIQ